MYQSIGRIIPRPGSGDMAAFNEATPDLILSTLFKSGAHLLKSNFVYELRLNELTGIIEVVEVGKSVIGHKWGHNFYDIPVMYGPTVWLTEEEYKQYKEDYIKEYGSFK